MPCGKAAKIGSYRLWRRRAEGSGRTRRGTDVYDHIYVGSADSSWMVRIPQTSPMYATVVSAYSDPDSEDFLKMLFGNMYVVSTMSNEYVHDGFMFLLEMMKTPYLLLPEQEMVGRIRSLLSSSVSDGGDSLDERVARMREYRDKIYSLIDGKIRAFVAEYDKMVEKASASEDVSSDDAEHDDIADQASRILHADDMPSGKEGGVA